MLNRRFDRFSNLNGNAFFTPLFNTEPHANIPVLYIVTECFSEENFGDRPVFYGSLLFGRGFGGSCLYFHVVILYANSLRCEPFELILSRVCKSNSRGSLLPQLFGITRIGSGLYTLILFRLLRVEHLAEKTTNSMYTASDGIETRFDILDTFTFQYLILLHETVLSTQKCNSDRFEDTAYRNYVENTLYIVLN